MPEVCELTKSDYALLAYLERAKSASRKDIIKKFSRKDKSVAYRLNTLSGDGFRMLNGKVVSSATDTRYILQDEENAFRITHTGKKALYDYQINNREERRSFFAKSVLVPVFVAILTTLAVLAIEEWWPQLLRLARELL